MNIDRITPEHLPRFRITIHDDQVFSRLTQNNEVPKQIDSCPQALGFTEYIGWGTHSNVMRWKNKNATSIK